MPEDVMWSNRAGLEECLGAGGMRFLARGQKYSPLCARLRLISSVFIRWGVKDVEQHKTDRSQRFFFQ